MELVHWFIVLVSILPNGAVSVGHGTVLQSFETRKACEAALEREFGRGYSAGYVSKVTEDGLQLVLERNQGKDVMQCISPWTQPAPR